MSNNLFRITSYNVCYTKLLRLNEIATDCHLGISILDEKINVETQVKNACELLGLDPLYVANEGAFVCIVDQSVSYNFV